MCLYGVSKAQVLEFNASPSKLAWPKDFGLAHLIQVLFPPNSQSGYLRMKKSRSGPRKPAGQMLHD